MEAKAQIGRWGNSLALRIPKHICDYLELNPGDSVICNVENGKLVLEPVSNVAEYSLDEFLSAILEPCEEIYS